MEKEIGDVLLGLLFFWMVYSTFKPKKNAERNLDHVKNPNKKG